MKTLHELCQTPPFKDAKVPNKTKLARFNWIHKWISKWWIIKKYILKNNSNIFEEILDENWTNTLVHNILDVEHVDDDTKSMTIVLG